MQGWLLAHGFDPPAAGRIPLNLYYEARKFEREKELEAWRRIRWQTWVIGRWMGADVKHPEDLLQLDGDKPRGFSPEQLKEWSQKYYSKHGQHTA